MKKILTLSLILIQSLSLIALAQQDKENNSGIITYKIEYLETYGF